MGSTLNFLGSPAAPNPTPFGTAASGDTTIVNAAAGVATRVYAFRINTAAAVTVQVKRGSTVLETFQFMAAGNVLLDLRELPYYTTAINEALVLNLSSAVQVFGVVEASQGK